MSLFNKEEEQNMQAPIDKVKAMKQQGNSNDEIIQTLQKEGYPSSLIFDAINQNELEEEEPQNSNKNFSNNSMNQDVQQELSLENKPSLGNYDENTSYEELIEAIIDEKWNDLVKDVNKIIEWKNRMDSKINSMEQGFKEVKNNFERLHNSIVGKVGEYDKNILEVGSNVKAMEETFKKVLPVFADNVKELSRITEDIKTSTKKVSKK